MNIRKVMISSALLFCMICMQNMRAVVLTNPQGMDGFGAQFLTIISAVLYADLHNMQFIYSPFKAMEHNYDNDPEFLVKKENLINFMNHFEVNTHARKDVRIESGTIGMLYAEQSTFPLTHNKALKNIKRIFRANKKTEDHFNNGRFNIAVHVRRHNQHDSRIDGTNTPDTLFLKIVNTLRQVYVDKNPVIHIYSQGNETDFAQYKANDVILHLNDTVEQSFPDMVLADVLVTSRSSYSYTAALLSDGIIYYIPFWHTRLQHWIPVDVLLKN